MGNFQSVEVGEELTVSSSQCLELLCTAGGCCPPLSQLTGMTTPAKGSTAEAGIELRPAALVADALPLGQRGGR